jgi:hypothetical protein
MKSEMYKKEKEEEKYIDFNSKGEQNGTLSSKSNGKENKMVPSLARAMERRTKWYLV